MCCAKCTLAAAQAQVERTTLDHSNVTDLSSQWFYRFLAATWFWQLIARHLITQVCSSSTAALQRGSLC